jgi:hypothetical protein
MTTPFEFQGFRLTPSELLRLQKLAGNQAVLRLLRRLRGNEQTVAPDAAANARNQHQGEQG